MMLRICTPMRKSGLGFGTIVLQESGLIQVRALNHMFCGDPSTPRIIVSENIASLPTLTLGMEPQKIANETHITLSASILRISYKLYSNI